MDFDWGVSSLHQPNFRPPGQTRLFSALLAMQRDAHGTERLCRGFFSQQRKERVMRALIGSAVAALIAIAGLLGAFAQAGVTTQYVAASSVQRIAGDMPAANGNDEIVVARESFGASLRSTMSE